MKEWNPNGELLLKQKLCQLFPNRVASFQINGSVIQSARASEHNNHGHCTRTTILHLQATRIHNEPNEAEFVEHGLGNGGNANALSSNALRIEIPLRLFRKFGSPNCWNANIILLGQCNGRKLSMVLIIMEINQLIQLEGTWLNKPKCLSVL